MNYLIRRLRDCKLVKMASILALIESALGWAFLGGFLGGLSLSIRACPKP